MLTPQNSFAFGLYILKVASRCNLNCTYCYVYNKGDDSWRGRPAIMSDDVFKQTLRRIDEECNRTGQNSVKITFHGGEPCLVGAKRFDMWCSLAREILASRKVTLTLQTNGTLLDKPWAEALSLHHVNVGVSVDGPRTIHDANRVDHRGQGSYDKVVRGLRELAEAGIPYGILTVVSPGMDGLMVHRALTDLGPASISYLLPDYTHDTVHEVRRRHGPHPCADFLLPVFDDWWFNGGIGLQIANFWHIATAIMGGSSRTDTLGNGQFGYLVVETDGDVEGLDCLKVCGAGTAASGVNVIGAPFRAVLDTPGDLAASVFCGTTLPTACRACPEASTCGGGYLPHRFSRDRGFDNPSVWCADLLMIFGHMRHRLDVSHQETALRRRVLAETVRG